MNNSELKIGKIKIGDNYPCLIIAEVAQAHDGSLGFAHSYIDKIAEAGADAVKFQTHIASAESTKAEPWRVKFSLQDKSRFDYWKRLEFSEEQWAGLKRHAEDRNLIFISSPFSAQAVKLLTRIGVKAWKIASGEVSNYLMINDIIKSRLPILLSTGMSPLSEIDKTVEYLQSKKAKFAVLQCTSAYPCAPEKVGLNMINVFKDRYRCIVGLSDHSGTIYPGIVAASLKTNILEVHVTFDRGLFGPDVSSSVTFSELRTLIQGVRFVEKMTAANNNKIDIPNEIKELRSMFMKSLVLKKDLVAGTKLKKEFLIGKKPGTGIPVSEIDSVTGKKLLICKKQNEQLRRTDIGE